MLSWTGEAGAVRISQQGHLRGPSGVGVDGTYEVTFALYENAYTTAALWKETWPTVEVQDGVFALELGGVVDIDPLLLAGPDEVWIGVRLEAEAELPRARFNAIPRAGSTAHAAAAGGLSGPIGALECSGCIDAGDLADAAVGGAILADSGVTADRTGFGWAAGDADGAALGASDVECLACIQKSEIAADVAHATDLLFVGTTLGKLGCGVGERPIVTLNEFGKNTWACARATTAWGYAATDPWGDRWDGAPRPALPFADAQAACAALGARLPTVTEIWRNNATTGTGSLGPTQDADWLWSSIFRRDAEVMITRVGSGAITHSALGSARRYRCIWPAADNEDFVGDSCHGPPGASCFPLGDLYHVDVDDRAPLPLGAAMAECRMANARLPLSSELETVIRAGLPNGSDEMVWTTEHYQTCWSGCKLSGAPAWTVKWTGTDGNWPGTYVGRWYYDTARFRCVGLKDRGALSAPTGGGWAEPAQHIRADGADRPKAPFMSALDACLIAKGHLLYSGELWSAIAAGLPGPTGDAIWTAEPGDLRPLTLAWAIAPQMLWPSSTFAASGLNQYPLGTARPYRCGYYATAPPGPPPACHGGCFQVVKGNVRLYGDALDRAPAPYMEALDTCAELGGQLPSMRDLSEQIRLGLPNGTTAAIWTTSTAYDDSKTQATKLVAHWFDQNTTWTPPDSLSDPNNGFGQRPLAAVEAFRCVWTNEAR